MSSYRTPTFPVDAKLGLPEAKRLFSYSRGLLAGMSGGLTAVWLEFGRLLCSLDLCKEGMIDPQFIELLDQRFTPEVLQQAGITVDAPHAALHLWRSPARIGLALFALEMPLRDFVMRASICRFPHRISADPIIARIHELAPAAVADLKKRHRRITIWTLADHLSDALGADFLNNFACMRRVRFALEWHVESDCEYAQRIIDLMYERPIALPRFHSFNDAIRKLGLIRVLTERADLRQDLRLAFKSARKKVGGKAEPETAVSSSVLIYQK